MLISMSFCDTTTTRHEIPEVASISPDQITTIKHIPESNKEFIAGFLPKIQTANNKILLQRNMIIGLKDSVVNGETLNDFQFKQFNHLLKKYKLDPVSDDPAPQKEDLKVLLTGLLERLDIIPIKLVMAQAIIESGWGSSGFAKNQNNYFGVHCYTEGCGVKPAGDKDARFYVKSYPNEMAAIEDYIWNLNTGNAYKGLREARTDERLKHKSPDALELAKELSKYSEKGEEYIDMVSNIIKNYVPENAEELVGG